MKAIIEIPRGDNRRRHLREDKSGFIDLGPTRDVIPVNDGVMPVHYGLIPETLNIIEGDEVDILVLSTRKLEIGQEIVVEPIALLRREDGDDKVVAVDETRQSIQSWHDIPEDERSLIESFFSYHSKFLAIEDREKARKYGEQGSKQYLAMQKKLKNSIGIQL
jgi:inorganic pyrophosphatase